MKPNIDLSSLTPSTSIRGADERETADLRQMNEEAVSYLQSFPWCQRVLDSYLGIAVAGVVSVFLLRIDPSDPAVDGWVWVIVGDLPPAYITIDNAANAASALDCYVCEMAAWVDAIKTGQPIDDLIPVNAEPTPKMQGSWVDDYNSSSSGYSLTTRTSFGHNWRHVNSDDRLIGTMPR